jgi:hypothetical protein
LKAGAGINVRKGSKTARTMEIAGRALAAGLLQTNPELSEMIAVWLKLYLEKDLRKGGRLYKKQLITLRI